MADAPHDRKSGAMTVDKAVLTFAGIMVLTSLALAEYVHHAWLLLTLFVGVNLLQAGISGFCPAAILFRRLGLRPGPAFFCQER